MSAPMSSSTGPATRQAMTARTSGRTSASARICRTRRQAGRSGTHGRASPALRCCKTPSAYSSLPTCGAVPSPLIGFPAGERQRQLFFECTTLHLGISANSRQKELAWEFVRLALSQENQQRLAERWYSPVRYDVMTAQLEADVSDEAVRAQYLQLVSQPLIFIGYNEDISQIVLDEGAAFLTARTRRRRRRSASKTASRSTCPSWPDR